MAWLPRLGLLVVATLVTASVPGCSRGGIDTTRPTSPTSATPSNTTTTTGVAGTTAPSTTTTPATTSTTAAVANFSWRSESLSAQTQAMMTGRSWRPGCPVPLGSLRLVDLTYWGFDGMSHQGQLVVNSDSVPAIVVAFRALFVARFPVRQMRLVDYFGADDEASMVADNTSGFNCREVPGTSVWSQHAFGRAVDLDPLENPEIQGGEVDPSAAAQWADRNLTAPGMIHRGDAAWSAFASVGWRWGGDWVSLKDYQHFSANGL